MLTSDPILLGADPAEISDHLLTSGLTRVETFRSPAGLVITADEGDNAVENALLGWTPTTTGYDPSSLTPLWLGQLPDYVVAHVQHLKDYRDTVRAGTVPTTVQTTHVIADIIDALRFLNSRVTGD